MILKLTDAQFDVLKTVVGFHLKDDMGLPYDEDDFLSLVRAIKQAEIVRELMRKAPYPSCRMPEKCNRKGYCQADPCCHN